MKQRKPQPYGLDVEPSGMSGECKDRLERIIEHYGMTRVGSFPSPYGEVFIAERRNKDIKMNGILCGGWDGVWAAREVMFINTEFGPFTSQEYRITHLYAEALRWLKGRAGKFGEKVYDA